MRKPEERGALFTHFEKDEWNGRSLQFFHWRCKRKQNGCSSTPQVLSFFPGRVALAQALCLRGEISGICPPISLSRHARSNELICHYPLASAWLCCSHDYLSSLPGLACAGAWDRCSSPPRWGVRVSGASKAGPAMVSLGRMSAGVVCAAPVHLFPLDSLHKKSCWNSI